MVQLEGHLKAPQSLMGPKPSKPVRERNEIHVPQTCTEGRAVVGLDEKENKIHELKFLLSAPSTVFVGFTGAGKSALLNLVFQQSHLLQHQNLPAKSEADLLSETKNFHYFYNEEQKRFFVDTVGLLDGDNPKDAFDKVSEFLRCLTPLPGCTHPVIVLAVKWDRLSHEAQKTLLLLDGLLDPSWTDNAILVVTHWSNGVEEFNQRVKAGTKNTQSNYMKDALQLLLRFKNKITVQNKPEEAADEARLQFLHEFKQAMQTCGPVKFREKNAFQQMFAFIKGLFNTPDEQLEKLTIQYKTTACPECPLCNLCAPPNFTTCCANILCSSCAAKIRATYLSRCPYCRSTPLNTASVRPHKEK